MNILIVNCTSERSNYAAYTKGGDALIYGAVYALRKYFPDASYSTLIQYSQEWCSEFNASVVRQDSIHHLTPFSLGDLCRSSIDLLSVTLVTIKKIIQT